MCLGITVDTISCINIVLAIGLCVDYSAHIAHAFIVAEGPTRVDRALSALVAMGPAILNGGVTTFLALVLLGGSQSHAFIVFFKVFLLTVVFGLFHGLVFLPVVLGLVGTMRDNEDVTDLEKHDSTSEDEVTASSDRDSGVATTNSSSPNNNGDSKSMRGLSNVGYVYDEVSKKPFSFFFARAGREKKKIVSRFLCMIYAPFLWRASEMKKELSLALPA